MSFLPKNKSQWLLSAVILLMIIGGFLRFFRLETKMRFIWDEGRDMLVIRRMIVDKDLLLLGPFNEQDGRKDFFGVFHYYLMTPALKIADFNPLGPAVLTAGLGVIGIVLVYWLVKEWESPLMALLVAGLYAVNPLVIKYVQWPWNPNTVPFFALLYGLAITKFHKTSRWQWSGIAGLLLGLLFQLHYFTIALAVWWLAVLLTKKTNWQQKLLQLFIFSLSWLLPNLTFVLFDLRHEFFLSKILLDSFTEGSSQQLFIFNVYQLIPNAWQYLVNLSTGLFGAEPMTATLITLGWITGLTYYSWQAIKQKKVTLASLVSLSLIFFLIITAMFPSIPDDYHSSYLWFGILLVVLKIITDLLYTRFDVRLATIVYLLILGYFISANHLLRSPEWSENMPLIRSISKIISEDVRESAENSFNIADLTTADTKGKRFRYFLDVEGVTPLHSDLYPEAQTLYTIIQEPLENRLNEPVWELQSFVDQQAILLETIDGIRVYKLTKN